VVLPTTTATNLTRLINDFVAPQQRRVLCLLSGSDGATNL